MSHEIDRYGSAEWATKSDLRRAGLLKPGGPMLGFTGRIPLFLENDAPMLTLGGAGSGKLRDLLAYTVCGYRADDGRLYSPARMFIHDPRGELTAISIHNLVRLRQGRILHQS